MRRNQRGFTLMELLVVIVIVAILAAVAVPLYTNYVRDAHRTEARGAISAVITAEQAYFQRHGGTSYQSDLQVLGSVFICTGNFPYCPPRVGSNGMNWKLPGY